MEDTYQVFSLLCVSAQCKERDPMLDRVLMSLLSVYVDHQIRDCLGGCMRGSFLPPAGTTGAELREGGREGGGHVMTVGE